MSARSSGPRRAAVVDGATTTIAELTELQGQVHSARNLLAIEIKLSTNPEGDDQDRVALRKLDFVLDPEASALACLRALRRGGAPSRRPCAVRLPSPPPCGSGQRWPLS